MTRADALVAGLPAQWVIADTAFDGDGFRRRLADRGTGAVIPSNPSRAAAIPHDRDPYRERHLVECSISKLKQFRRIAVRGAKARALRRGRSVA